MSVGIYKLRDETSGSIRILFVPRYTGNKRLPNDRNYYTIKTATEKLGSQFDHTATFFCNDTIGKKLEKQGFTNVVYSSKYPNEKWLFDNGNYIKFFSSGDIRLYVGNVEYVLCSSKQDTARTFINDIIPPTIWVNGVVGYYGELYTITDDEFNFYYYYPVNSAGPELFESIWKDLKPFTPSTDPYDKGGSSESGGGTGTFGGGSTIFGGNTDSIDIPDLPSLSAVDTGFITLFNPTLSQLNSLASYMWSDVFSLDTFKKLYSDPMDCILGLSIVPVQPTSGDTGPVKIGNISTDVMMNKASSQYVSVDCGTVEVKEYWGGYLDYSPYTKCEIYLPYVGVHEISVDDIMNKSVHIVYHVDILSGACNAYVKCGDSVLYTFIGQCSSSIPISGNDWTNTINGVLSIAGNIGSLVASGGASAPTELPSMAQNAINALKPNVEKSGAMSGTGGMLGIQKPYIILTRPNQALPENQNKYTGYPSFITMNLGECSGYTEIETIRLENMTCTDDELTEIETLLKQGVVF